MDFLRAGMSDAERAEERRAIAIAEATVAALKASSSPRPKTEQQRRMEMWSDQRDRAAVNRRNQVAKASKGPQLGR